MYSISNSFLTLHREKFCEEHSDVAIAAEGSDQSRCNQFKSIEEATNIAEIVQNAVDGPLEFSFMFAHSEPNLMHLVVNCRKSLCFDLVQYGVPFLFNSSTEKVVQALFRLQGLLLNMIYHSNRRRCIQVKLFTGYPVLHNFFLSIARRNVRLLILDHSYVV